MAITILEAHYYESAQKNKGFYIALVLITLGAAAIGAAAVINMVKELSQPPQVQQSQPQTQEDITRGLNDAELEAGKEQQNVPVTPSTASGSQSASSSQSSLSGQQSAQSEPATWQQAQAKPFVLPVSGQTLAGFSGDELVYNETMQDWRTHNGTDIACEKGTEVKAPVDGEVLSVATDDLWGGVIELKWGEDTVRICGVTVSGIKAGDTVAQGDKLGVSAEIPAESKEAAHVHVEVISNGEAVNAEAYSA